MTDKQKIIKYLDFKGISKNKFYTTTGLSVGFLDSGSSLGVDKLRKIIDNYQDFNLDWFLKGEGDMIKTSSNENFAGSQKQSQKEYETKPAKNVTFFENDVLSQKVSQDDTETKNAKNRDSFEHSNSNKNSKVLETEPNLQKMLPFDVVPFRLRTDKNKDFQVIPIYSMEASAGLVGLLDNPAGQVPLDYISIPNLPNCDGALYVTGDSMYPLLKSGDIVAYKQMRDIENDIFFGEMYIVSLQVSGDELVVVKYLQKSERDSHIKLVSQNKHHPDKDVRLDQIRALALVKASIRYNMMY